MSESNPRLELWIVQELVQLGISVPKFKKMKLQIHKKSLKGKQCGIFGVALIKLISSIDLPDPDEIQQKVPCFLEKMTKFLSEHVSHNCIFRKNGNSDRMKHLRENLELGGSPLEGTFVEDAAGVLKAWFRDLPVPLIPQEYHELFFGCHKVCESSSNSKALLLACALLPCEHLATLKHLLTFLSHVAKNSAVNKMSSQSLAIVFAPNIMPTLDKYRPEKNISIDVLKEKQAKEREVIQWLIDHSEEVSKTPESVELLANLTLHCNKKNESRKQTKRRKSMCADIGVKIKKMVGPHSSIIHADSNKGTKNSKRKAETLSETVDSSTKRIDNTPKIPHMDTAHETPSQVLSNKLNQLNIVSGSLLPSGKQKTKRRKRKTPLRNSCSPCYSECSPEFSEHIKVSVDIADSNLQRSDSERKIIFSSPEISKSEEDCSYQLKFEQPQEPNRKECCLHVAEIITPVNIDSFSSSRQKSNLKRGRPNTVTSGLKSAKRGKTRTSSVEIATPCSGLLQLSKRRSRSASSIYAQNYSNDEKFANIKELAASVQLSRVLNFTDAGSGGDLSGTSNSIKFSPRFETDNLLGTSLGFSPILDSSKLSPKSTIDSREWLSINSNLSRNPFNDLTNGSEIPAMHSSIGENSIFSDVVEISNVKNSNCSPLPISFSDKDNFITPSPIMSKKERKSQKEKLSITASSTPANDSSKISWQCAHTFDFNEKIVTDDVDGTKRESIVKLRQTNAGKVLANINLYDNKPSQPQDSVCSTGMKPTVFERNALATKSVRERGKKFFDQQGFKVPSGCPSSIRRITKISKGIRSQDSESSVSHEKEYQGDEETKIDDSICLPIDKDAKKTINLKKMNLALETKYPMKPVFVHSKILF